jgi:GNAT superfamily N-acetyltransferase
MTLAYRVLRGADVAAALDDLARLRISVFRDWPYLYDGDLAYEREYMASYRDNPRAVLVGAFDGQALVGASTGTPLEDHAEDFARAFDGQAHEGRGIALSDVFYCAESVLLPAYRGQGAGHAFFDHREDHARGLGRKWSAFCAVERPADHPARPADYRPLVGFWRKRGYVPLAGAKAGFAWKDLGESSQSHKEMQFWIKPL